MKSLILIVMVGVALVLVACGDPTTDQSLPGGVAPSTPGQASDMGDDSGGHPVGEDPIELPPIEVHELAGYMSYRLPEGWSAIRARPGEMRLFTLLPPDAYEGAELAIAKWPGNVGGFKMNIDRWCKELGQPVPNTDMSTGASSGYEQFEIDGTDATYIPLANKETNKASLIFWAPRGAPGLDQPEETWTFKLTCTAEQALKLEPMLKDIVKTIEFE